MEVLTTQENEAKIAQLGLLKENSERRYRWLVAEFPQMTFTQMHELLRMVLLGRIQRRTVSISLLCRQTGFGRSHLSNFLHSKRQLSLQGLDRILASQHMTAEDVLQSGARPVHPRGKSVSVHVVSHHTALFEPYIRASATEMTLELPPGSLDSLKARPHTSRQSWQRFVAIRVPAPAALPMEPLLLPDALAVIDRHYNSLIPYRDGRRNLYAVRDGTHLRLGYVELVGSQMVLRPLNLAHPVGLIDTGPDTSPGEYIAGRVVMTVNQV